MHSDAELLRRYAFDQDEAAFADFVQRHAGLVYGAALRRTNGRASIAEEVAQKIFTTLAQRAALLCRHPALAAWLHRSTRHAAIDALRAETRRHRLTQSLLVMPDTDASAEPPVDWEHLRPVLDDALDQLRPHDRELMVLRFFQGLTFAEIGGRLQVAENAARMRTDRALDRLRRQLQRRGVTSTSAALGLLLGNQMLAACPAGVTGAVTASALAATSPAVTSVLCALFMSKITAPIIAAALAAGASALIYISTADSVSAAELAALRRDHARLSELTAPSTSADQLAAASAEYERQLDEVAHAFEARGKRHTDSTGDAPSHPIRSTGAGPATPAAPDPRARGYVNRGQATAHDAAITFGWAGAMSDPDAFARLIYFEDDGRAKTLSILAGMPESIRARYPTAEQFYGLVLAAATLQGPPPDADSFEKSMSLVELRPGRVAVRRTGSDVNFHEYQLTAEGWKWVLPERAVEPMTENLSSVTLAKLAPR